MSKINQVNYLEGEKTHQVTWDLPEKKGISFLDKLRYEITQNFV